MLRLKTRKHPAPADVSPESQQHVHVVVDSFDPEQDGAFSRNEVRLVVAKRALIRWRQIASLLVLFVIITVLVAVGLAMTAAELAEESQLDTRTRKIAMAEPERVAAAEPERVATAGPERVATAEPERVATAEPERVATAKPKGKVKIEKRKRKRTRMDTAAELTQWASSLVDTRIKVWRPSEGEFVPGTVTQAHGPTIAMRFDDGGEDNSIQLCETVIMHSNNDGVWSVHNPPSSCQS